MEELKAVVVIVFSNVRKPHIRDFHKHGEYEKAEMFLAQNCVERLEPKMGDIESCVAIFSPPADEEIEI